MIDSLGFFTVVVSAAAYRPINAVRTNDITWLPWGSYPDGLLLYRHLLPNPAFAQAIQNVPYGSDPDAVMGDYFPQVAYCTRATAEAAGSPARDVFNEIGRASSRGRVCPYVEIPGVAVTLKKKTNQQNNQET